MLKEQCENAIRALCHLWWERCVADMPARELRFHRFFDWLKENHPRYLRFRTTTSVEYDVEMWFHDELKARSPR